MTSSAGARPMSPGRGSLVVALILALAIVGCQPAESVPVSAITPSPTTESIAIPREVAPVDVLRSPAGLPHPQAGTRPSPALARSASPTPSPAPVAADLRSRPPAPRVGRLAPDFTLGTLGNEQIHLADLRGRTVLLNFWATWCGPCKQEMPDLEATYQELKGEGLVVLGVDQAEDAAMVRRFVEQIKVTYPIALDPDGDVGLRYQIFGLPASFLIDADGVIRDRRQGALTREEMVAKVKRAQAARGKPLPEPVSIANTRGSDALAAVVGERRITVRDVDRRLDVDLALERLGTGAPSEVPSDADLARARVQTLNRLVDEELLVQAARAAGLTVPSNEVDAEVERLGTNLAKSRNDFVRELGRNGVTLHYLREVLERGLLASRFVDERILSGESPDPRTAVDKWLKAERARVKPEIRLGGE